MNDKSSQNPRLISFIAGSNRLQSKTSVCAHALEKLFHGDAGLLNTFCFDPSQNQLNLNFEENDPLMHDLELKIKHSQGVILITPEYHGSFSGVLKGIIDHLGFPSILAQKPVGLIGVASGVMGATKSIEHLRGVCAHVGAVVMPKSVSIANVDQAFDEAGQCQDPVLLKRLMRWVKDFQSFSAMMADQNRSVL